MRIEQSYDTPIQGVSTLAPRNRVDGQATTQLNFRSDPVNKLTRRPPLKWLGSLLDVTSGTDILNHSYTRGDTTYRYLLNKDTGDVHCYINDTLHMSLTVPAYGTGQNIVVQTINDETFFVNTDIVVQMLPDTDDATIQKVSHINVTEALNYSETVQVNITKSNGDRASVSYKVPSLGTSNPNYDAADRARATTRVAQELAARINAGGTIQTGRIPNYDYPLDNYNDADWMMYCDPNSGNFDSSMSVCKPYLDDFPGISGVTAVALGSTVAVWEDSGEWLNVEIESGQGDRTTVAFNQVTEKVEGLPLYAKVGTRITVRPDPTSEKGTYYLEATRIADDPSGEELEEVVWVESRNPHEPYALDSSTLPFSITFNNELYIFEVNDLVFRDRKNGDNDSVEQPEFVGKTIRNISYFQKRLVFLSDDSVVMSETDDLLNFWKQSAVQLLVTDPVTIASSAVEVDKLAHAIPHNRDLLVTAANGQFKISGSSAVTPQTVSMALTTKNECQTEVEPVAMGNSVFFPIDYGDSTGIQEYTGERDTNQDHARSITEHVIGLMPGTIKFLKASPNLEMLVVQTQGDPDTLFVYEQFTLADGNKSQRAWSTWKFSQDGTIIDIEFKNDRMTLIVDEDDKILKKELDMYARVATGAHEVFLDDLYLDEFTGGESVRLRYPYADDIVLVNHEDNELALLPIAYTRLSENSNTLVFNSPLEPEAKVYVGRKYRSAYRPTRPFRRTEDGLAITTDRVRVGKWIVAVVDTNEISMTIDSPYVTEDLYWNQDQTFNGRYLASINNILGEVTFTTDDVKFSFNQDAKLAEAEFYTDNHLGCTIAGLSWEGQYFASKGRM
jgi:hypothetical protein